MELYNKYKTLLFKNGICTPLRLAHFFAQIDHESGLKPISENLNYSKEGLLKTFSRYFTPEQAKEYAKRPISIANRVYSARMGNGGEISGDGWRYRGRGFLQITGKDNYKQLSIDTGLDCVNNPDLLLIEANAMISALWFWNKNKLNLLADKDNLDAISDLINLGRVTVKTGDSNGFLHRKLLLDKYKKLLL